MSFRARLLLAAFYLTAAAVLALSIPLALTVERRADSDYEAAVLGDAAILAARVSDLVVPAAEPPSPRLDRLVAESARARDRRVVVTDAAGTVVADSAGTATSGQLYATDGRPEFRVALFQGRIDTRTRYSDTLGEDLLLVTVPVVDRGRVVGAVRLSAGTEAVETAVRASWVRLALLGGVVIVAGVLVAWLLELPLGRQIRRLAEASTRLGQGDLASRAPEEGPEELRVLARSFNQMAADLEHSIEAQREFVANASHQLRTPLTGLRLRLEAISSEGGPSAEQAVKAEAELDRLTALVDDLLALAQATASDSTAGAVDLAAVAGEAVNRWRDAATAAGKRLELRARDEPSGVGEARGPRPGTRQPDRQRAPLLLCRRGGAGGGEHARRSRVSCGRGHRARYPAGGSATRVRALLPRSERTASGRRHRARPRHRRGARPSLGRRGQARGRAGHPGGSRVSTATCRTLTLAWPSLGKGVGSLGDVRRAGLIALVLVGLAFPAGLGLAVYVASGSSLVPPAVTARVPTGEIARPSTPPATTLDARDDGRGDDHHRDDGRDDDDRRDDDDDEEDEDVRPGARPGTRARRLGRRLSCPRETASTAPLAACRLSSASGSRSRRPIRAPRR